jgi:uncharacterized protein (DUF3084 family)
MRIRWPLMLRSTHAAAIDAQLRRHHIHQGDLHDKLNRASAERKALATELEIARIEIQEDNEGIVAQSDEIQFCHQELTRLESQLASFGHVEPFDWAAPLPPETNTVIVAGYWGVQVQPTE